MKKLLCRLAALLLVAALAMSLVSFSFAEEGSAFPAGPVALDFTVALNSDAVTALLEQSGSVQDSSLLPAVGAAYRIVGSLIFHIALDGENFSLGIRMKDAPADDNLITADGVLKDGQLQLVSSLLPEKTALSVPAEVNVSTNIPELTDAQKLSLAAVLTVEGSKLRAQAESAMGEAETGSWTFEGAEFTSRRRVNMTTKEMLAACLTAFGNVLKDETAAGLLAALGAKKESMDVESALENLNNTPDENLPALTAYVYSGADGDAVIDVDLSNEEGAVTLCVCKVGTKSFVRFTEAAPDNARAEISAVCDSADRSWQLDADVSNVSTSASGPFRGMTVHAWGAFAEDGKASATLNLFINGTDMLTATLDAFPAEALTPADFTGMKIITGEDLARMSETESKAFKGQLIGGLLRVLARISLTMPDEVSELMTQIMTLTSK